MLSASERLMALGGKEWARSLMKVWRELRWKCEVGFHDESVLVTGACVYRMAGICGYSSYLASREQIEETFASSGFCSKFH